MKAKEVTAFPTGEDTPWPQGTFKTRIGDLTFKNGYPSNESVDVLYDAMDFQRATQAYIWALPLVSFADWKNEWRKQGAGNFDILVMQSFDQKHGLITPNMTTPYYIAFTDLNETGPLVVEAPAGAIGGGVSKGGMASLYIDGKKVGQGRVAATASNTFSLDETTDVGEETGTTVAEDMTIEGSRFTGRIKFVQIDTGMGGKKDHVLDPEERFRVAMARQ